MAEQVLAGKQKYHKRCFTCNNKPSCNKSLDSGSFNDHEGNYCGFIIECFSNKTLTTVFVDTRLWKTKHWQKRFQNFRQSYMLSTDWIEIRQSQPLV